jgi:hypothetical protein
MLPLRSIPIALSLLLVCDAAASAQQAKQEPAKAKRITPDEKLKADQAEFAQQPQWIYNDVDAALAASAKEGKPILFVFRCVPCEACSHFDREVTAPDAETAALMDKFVTARVTLANGLDMKRFQFDWDQSFHVVFMDKDGRVLGRFGTRSQRPEDEDMTTAGFRATMRAVLDLAATKDAKALAAAIEGKKAASTPYARPELMPTLLGTYTSTLAKSGPIARSCIHCHQIRDAQRNIARADNDKFTPKLLYPYPLPDTIGMRLSPDHAARVLSVEADSPAAKIDIRPGDEIVRMEGQAIVSPADVQWILENTDENDSLTFEIRRGDTILSQKLTLTPGWRAKSDLSWRPTSWNLRRMATGGMRLENIAQDEYSRLGLEPKSMALRVKHVGQFGDHATAKRAGFLNGDVIVKVDDRTDIFRETDLFAYTLARPKGIEVRFQVLRNGKMREFRFPTR